MMKPIEMNQSLLSIKEKFYGFEIRQIVDAVLAGGASLAVNFLLPSELGVVRGIIASIVAVPCRRAQSGKCYSNIRIPHYYGISVLCDAGDGERVGESGEEDFWIVMGS